MTITVELCPEMEAQFPANRGSVKTSKFLEWRELRVQAGGYP